jgi:hypothetical protein
MAVMSVLRAGRFLSPLRFLMLISVRSYAEFRVTVQTCFIFREWGETESTRYPGNYWTYCTSPGIEAAVVQVVE